MRKRFGGSSLRSHKNVRKEFERTNGQMIVGYQLRTILKIILTTIHVL